jgi:hypothetical protein
VYATAHSPDDSSAYRTAPATIVAGNVAVDEQDDSLAYPRTTGGDAITIAAVLDPIVRAEPIGRVGATTLDAWLATLDDLARDALVSPVRDYVHNDPYWHALADVCIELDAAGAPLPPRTLWDALIDQLAGPIDLRNVGPKDDGPFQHFDGVRTFEDLYLAQHKYLGELRGSDKLEPPPGGAGGKRIIPRTTNRDVIQLADYWSKQLKQIRRVFGHEAVENRWNNTVAQVNFLARSGNPDAVYPNNNAFWRALQNTAFHISAADELPTDTQLFMDALNESFHSLPQRLKAGAEAVASGAAKGAEVVANEAGKIVHAAGNGLFSGFGLPLLLGGGALVGLVLLSRRGDHGATKEA